MEEIHEIRETFDEVIDLALANAGVMDRFEGTAVLGLDDALAIGTLGVVARASGLVQDARLSHPFKNDVESFVPAIQKNGDVMARFHLRVEEFRTSLRMVEELSGTIGSLDARGAVTTRSLDSGLGIVEGWRGTILHRVELDPTGTISRARTIDPSFFNWPALSVALSDTIVPDFPLANKSFNLSYAGNDL
jgi:Ni,Fe-hydrogenase III large subunit